MLLLNGISKPNSFKFLYWLHVFAFYYLKYARIVIYKSIYLKYQRLKGFIAVLCGFNSRIAGKSIHLF